MALALFCLLFLTFIAEMKNPVINLQVFVYDRRNNSIGGHAIEFSSHHHNKGTFWREGPSS